MHAPVRSLARVFCSVVAALSLITACGGVRLEPVHSSVQRPSNVALYVAVEENGTPITGLTEKNFRVEEDGVALEATETRLTLLDRDSVALHHTVVLVDLSGAYDEKSRNVLSRGTANLVAKLRPTQGVSVLGFDGSPRLHKLGEFPQSADEAAPTLDAIVSFRSQDESRNLNGAVIEGLRELDSRLMRQQKPVRVGTLVVITLGDDLAGRVPEKDMRAALDETSHQLYAVGVEARESRQLSDIGRRGVERSQDLNALPTAIGEIGARLKKHRDKYYLVQYCSPARGGLRRVRFAVEYGDADGGMSQGSVDLEFDATGFTGGCDPNTRPRFVTALSRPGEIEAERSEKKKKAASSPGGGTGAGTSGTASQGAAPTSPSADGSSANDDEPIVAPPASGDYAD